MRRLYVIARHPGSLDPSCARIPRSPEVGSHHVANCSSQRLRQALFRAPGPRLQQVTVPETNEARKGQLCCPASGAIQGCCSAKPNSFAWCSSEHQALRSSRSRLHASQREGGSCCCRVSGAIQGCCLAMPSSFAWYPVGTRPYVTQVLARRRGQRRRGQLALPPSLWAIQGSNL